MVGVGTSGLEFNGQIHRRRYGKLCNRARVIAADDEIPRHELLHSAHYRAPRNAWQTTTYVSVDGRGPKHPNPKLKKRPERRRLLDQWITIPGHYSPAPGIDMLVAARAAMFAGS